MWHIPEVTGEIMSHPVVLEWANRIAVHLSNSTWGTPSQLSPLLSTLNLLPKPSNHLVLCLTLSSKNHPKRLLRSSSRFSCRWQRCNSTSTRLSLMENLQPRETRLVESIFRLAKLPWTSPWLKYLHKRCLTLTQPELYSTTLEISQTVLDKLKKMWEMALKKEATLTKCSPTWKHFYSI